MTGAGRRAGRGAALITLAALAGLPTYAFLVSEPTLAARLLVAALLVTASAAPSAALLLIAALSPLAIPIGDVLGTQFRLTEVLPLAVITGWLLRAIFGTPRPRPRREADPIGPAAVLATAIAASAAVQLWVLQPGVADAGAYAGRIAEFLGRSYFLEQGPFRPLSIGLQGLSGLAIFIATVVLVEADARVGRRLATIVVAGAAGVSALSLNRLLSVSLRQGDFWQDLAQHVRTIRISAAFPDLNGAGSYLAMALCVTVALALSSSKRWPRAGWFAVGALLTAAVWLTGSRAALIAVLLVLPALVLGLVWHRRRLRLALVALLAAGAVALLPVVVARVALPVETGRPLGASAGFRLAQTRMALRMFAAYPIQGAGYGMFQSYAPVYADPGIPDFVRFENAHNNYLQILAELGLAGFLPFVWLLGCMVRRARQGAREPGNRTLVAGTSAGLVAFGLTCLVGHPLLIEPIAVTFWGVMGLLGGLTGRAPTGEAEARSPWIRRLPVVAIVVLIITVPLRGNWTIAATDMRHTAFGFAEWEPDEGGTRARRVIGPAQFFVPASAVYLRLPLRVESGGPPYADISVSLDRRLANRVRVHAGTSTEIELVLPRDWTGRRFRSVQLAVGPTSPDGRPLPQVFVAAPVVTPPQR